ncbi:hypothetical protein [Pygmaiobacter massiliensis]|uniref:hypothetical protein n=1 Tax=Pygmaiobacter massiliensis TaxID=1917873 RepID=UPI0011AFBF90|nr:hypothetical protein [Pygmaiobacter massiliensis]
MQTIKLDLQRQSILTPLKAKQNDRYSRFFKLELWDNSTEFQLPEGAVFTLRYVAPSGCGWYDTITEIDGKKTHSAFQVSENEVTVELAEAMLTLPGSGTLCLQIYTASGYRIGTWNIPIEIEEDPCSDQNVVASDYYNVLTAQIAQTLGYRDAAEKAATAAAQSATNASNKAVDANNSAGAADASAKAAKTSETNAAASASTAATKATAADTSANAAKTSETNAAASASTATTKATAADASAKAAKTSETNAAASASTAGASATAAAESAAAAAESAKQASIPNRNLLDNASFIFPINQRGKTTYSAAGYTIDRWAIAYNQLTITAQGIVLTKNANLTSHIYQILTTNSTGKTRTLTVATADGIFTVSGTIGTQPVRKETPFGYIQFYIPSGLDAVLIDFSKKGSTLYWAKLEEGEVATPFVPKTFSAELAECQMYFRMMFASAVRTSGNLFTVSREINMRIAPTPVIKYFAPYGAATVTDFTGCSIETTSTTVGYANLPTCAGHAAGGLNFELSADL